MVIDTPLIDTYEKPSLEGLIKACNPYITLDFFEYPARVGSKTTCALVWFSHAFTVMHSNGTIMRVAPLTGHPGYDDLNRRAFSSMSLGFWLTENGTEFLSNHAPLGVSIRLKILYQRLLQLPSAYVSEEDPSIPHALRAFQRTRHVAQTLL